MIFRSCLLLLLLVGARSSAADHLYWYFDERQGYLELKRDGATIGRYWRVGNDAGRYRPATATGYGEVCEPPLSVPDSYRVDPVPNFGVEKSKIHEAPVNAINGKPCSRKEALDAIQSGQLPDDRNKLRLTVIGQEAERKAVLNDLSSSPLLAAYREALVVQEYGPDEWPVKCGFKTDGHPSIYLQTPDGKVLHRQSDYADGPQGLATALRKTDPTYDPAKDPDARKSPLSNLKIEPWMIAAGLVGFYLMTKKEESK